MKNFTRCFGLALALFFLFIQTPLLASRIYVASGATGSGTSWASALGNIQTAINGATASDEIWVKGGVYTLASTITIKEGVSLYGGFLGNETTLSERNLVTNPKSSLTGGGAVRIITQTTDFAQQTIIDGFSLESGYAVCGGGALLKSGVSLSNCMVVNNFASSTSTGNTPLAGGGGIYVEGTATIVNCLIANNESEYGGGLNLRGGAQLINCTVVNNVANYNLGSNGRGAWLADGSVKIYNTVFWGNGASGANELTLNGLATIENCATDDGVNYGTNCINIPSTNSPAIFINPNPEKGNIPSFNIARIGDFKLASGSILIDNGENSFADALNAAIRPAYTGIIDIGCYQTKPQLHVIGVVVNNKTYDGTPNASINNYGQIDPADILSGDGGLVTLITTGITAANFQSKNASPSAQNVTFTGLYALGGSLASKYAIVQPSGFTAFINPLPIQIEATANQFKTYGDADPFEYAHTTTPPTIVGDPYTGELVRAAGETIGFYAITNNLLTYNSGTTNYSETFVGGQSFEIRRRPITITVTTNLSKIYGASDPTLTYGVSGLKTGHSLVNVTERAIGENVGVYAITKPSTFKIIDGASVDVTSNYNVTYVGANFEIKQKPITITADNKSKTYGVADEALTYTLSTPLVGSDVVTNTPTRVAGENIGTYAITQGALTINSNYAITFISGIYSITPKPITVTPTPNQSKVYGSTDPIYTYTFSPTLIGGDTFSGALSRVGGSNVNSYAYVVGTLAISPNYTIILANDYFNILPLDISLTVNIGQSKIYGDAEPQLTVTSNPSLIAGDSWSGTLLRDAGNNVGIYAITRGTLQPFTSSALPTNKNYNVIAFSNGVFEIKKRTVTLSASATVLDKVYDQKDTAFWNHGTLVNVVAGDDLDYSLQLAHFDNPNVGINKPVTVLCNLTGTSASNYSFTSPTGIVADVTPYLNASILVDAVSKEYDGSISATTPTLTLNGILVGDDVQISGGTALFKNKNAGENKVVTVSGIIVSGSDALNYAINNSATNSSSVIVPKAATPSISVTAQSVSKIYDGLLSASIPALNVNGLIAGDIVLATGSSAQFDTKNVGNNKVITVNGVTYSGNDALNYTLPNTVQNNTSSITPIILDASNDLEILPTSKIYDGLSTITNLSINLTSALPNDDVSVTYTSNNLSSKHQGIRDLYVTGITLSGADGGNYQIGTSTSRVITINPRPFTGTVSFANISKIYDGNTSVTTIPQLTVTGLLGSDEVIATANSASFSDANAGVTTVAVNSISYSGVDKKNYIMPTSTTNTQCTIERFPLLIKPLSGQRHALGSSESTIEYDILPVLLPNGDVLAGTLTREAGENIGFYSILQGSINNTNNSNYEIGFTSNVLYEIYSGVELRVKWGNTLVVNNVAQLYKSFQWYKNGIAIAGATLPYYAKEEQLCGEYKLKVTLADSSTLFSPTRVEANCNTQKSLLLYPNRVASGGIVTLKIMEKLSSINTTQVLESSSLSVEFISLDGLVTYSKEISISDEILLNAPTQRGGYIVVVKVDNEVLFREKVVVF